MKVADIFRLTRRQTIATAAAALVIVAGLGLGYWHFGPGARPAVEKLRIADANQPVFALLYVAQAKGYLEDERLDVTFTNFTLGRDALNSVLEGKADLATAYETPTVLQIYGGQRLGIVTTLHTSKTGHALVARHDRGIDSAGKLKGRRIGVTPGTSTEYFLSVFLASSGLRAADVTTVAVEPADYEKALADGTVDAQVAFNPPLANVLRSANGRLAVFHSDVYVETSVLLGLRDTLQAKPEAVRRLLKAIVRAEQYVRDNREESLRIVVQRLAHTYAERAIRDSWDGLRLEARLDHVLLTLLTEEARWFRDQGRFSTAVPDFREAIFEGPLRAVRPEAVSLVAGAARR